MLPIINDIPQALNQIHFFLDYAARKKHYTLGDIAQETGISESKLAYLEIAYYTKSKNAFVAEEVFNRLFLFQYNIQGGIENA